MWAARAGASSASTPTTRITSPVVTTSSVDGRRSRIEPVHRGEPGGRVAAIDQGTNSTRLLVLDTETGGDPIEISRDMVITRLGQGVDETGRLHPAAIDRAIQAIARFTRRARALHAEDSGSAATSAVRDAADRDVFLSRVRDVTSIEPEVIDGDREAALSFLGGTRGLDPADGPFLLFDIGGGSTEFVFGRDTDDRRPRALDTDGERPADRAGRPSDPPSAEDLEAFAPRSNRVSTRSSEPCRHRTRRTLVAVAGTATTLQACALGLGRYDPDLIHRSILTLAEAERTLRDLAAMTNEERAAIPVMPKGRGDVIVAGASILVGAMRRFGFEEALVSETDILDGLALDRLGVR